MNLRRDQDWINFVDELNGSNDFAIPDPVGDLDCVTLQSSKQIPEPNPRSFAKLIAKVPPLFAPGNDDRLARVLYELKIFADAAKCKQKWQSLIID